MHIAQCWNQEKTLSEIQNRVPECVEHGKIAENVGKVVFFFRKKLKNRKIRESGRFSLCLMRFGFFLTGPKPRNIQ